MSVLRDILEKGYVDQEILDALDEEQKQMLFIQMRQEQIRKFAAYEERLEREGPPSRKSKKKNIQWLSGADGDVWVWVMGDHPDDKTIEEILDDEARKEARILAIQELEGEGNVSEDVLKAQLGNLRVGASITDSTYDDSEGLFDTDTPLLFQSKQAIKPAIKKPEPLPTVENLHQVNGYTNGNSDKEPQPFATTVSSYTTPVPQVAVIGNRGATGATNGRGAPPPVPVRPPQLQRPSPTTTQASTNSQPTPMTSVSEHYDNTHPYGVRLRSPKTMTPDEASDEVHKRESEIFQTIQEKREQLKREADQESERQRIAWEAQEKRAREAEAQIRTIAQKAREQHRQMLRTSTSILPALRDTKATSLREAIKNLPRPPKPKNRQEIIAWFKRNELPQGTGLDPKTSMPAPWFHGIISRDAAEQLLHNKPTGSFLVRVSERIWGYTVSYIGVTGSCKHFLIERIEQGYQFLGTNQIVHDHLFDLISYHESAPITAKGGEILKWSVGQTGRPADYAELFPDLPSNNNYFSKGVGLVSRY